MTETPNEVADWADSDKDPRPEQNPATAVDAETEAWLDTLASVKGDVEATTGSACPSCTTPAAACSWSQNPEAGRGDCCADCAHTSMLDKPDPYLELAELPAPPPLIEHPTEHRPPDGCICPADGTYEAPEYDCPVHGRHRSPPVAGPGLSHGEGDGPVPPAGGGPSRRGRHARPTADGDGLPVARRLVMRWPTIRPWLAPPIRVTRARLAGLCTRHAAALDVLYGPVADRARAARAAVAARHELLLAVRVELAKGWGR